MQKVSQTSGFIELLCNGSSTEVIEEHIAFTLRSERKQFLHYAVAAKRKDIIALLLRLGADINERDDNGRTALHYAVANGNVQIVIQLLQSRAKFLPDNENCTPLRLSLRDPDSEVLITLLESYDPKFDTLSLKEIIDIIINNELPHKISHAAYLYLITKGTEAQITDLAKYFDFSYRDSKGRDATYLLIKAKKTQLLVSGHFPLDAKDNNGNSLVHIAIANGDAEVLAVLLLPKEKEGFGMSLEKLNNDGDGPIHIAIAHGQTETFSMLVAPKEECGYGMPLNVRNKLGNNPVLIAIANGQEDILAILLKSKKKNGYGLSLNVKNINGLDPVLTAIAYGQIEILSILLKPKNKGGYGLSLDVCDKKECGPVLTAIAHGQTELLSILLKPKKEGGYGLTLDVRNSNNLGPVLIACAAGQINLLSVLLMPVANGGYGMSLKANSSYRHDPVSIAINNNQIVLLSILIKSKVEGGYGIPINHLNIALQSPNRSILTLIISNYFGKIHLTKSLDKALDWADSQINPPNRPECKEIIIAQYQKLISHFIDTENHDDVLTVYEHLEKLSPNEGALFTAKAYQNIEQYDAAFQFYLIIYNNKKFPYYQSAGFELANMILTDNVIIDTKGVLTPLKEEASMEARAKSGLDADIMIWRAIKAYEYLEENNSEHAMRLRARLEQYFMGELAFSGNKNGWLISSVKKFKDYYCKKNPLILTSETYNTTLNLILESLESANKQPSLYSPRFIGGNQSAGDLVPEAEKPSQKL